MVGTGPDGAKSALARVVLVNASGSVVLDTHVRPSQPVTDYRTEVSGVSARHLVGAPGLEDVQARVAALLSGRILVGHALKNDLKALLLSHPRKLVRDTARYPPLMRTRPHVGGPSPAARRGRPAKLKELAASQLGVVIQEGAHSPVEDARAALALYRKHEAAWEASLTPKGRAAAAAARAEAAAAAGGERRRARAKDAAGGGGSGGGADGEEEEGEEDGGGEGEAGEAARGRRRGHGERRGGAGAGGAAKERPPRGGGGWSQLLARAATRQ